VLRHLRDAPTELRRGWARPEVLGHRDSDRAHRSWRRRSLWLLASILVRGQQTATLGLVQLQGDHEAESICTTEPDTAKSARMFAPSARRSLPPCSPSFLSC